MQSVSFPEVDSRHASSPPSIIALVIGLDFLSPEVPRGFTTVFAEANVNQEVAVIGVWLEIRGLLVSCPLVYWTSTSLSAIPAAKRACTFRLVVHGCAKWDDSNDRLGCQQCHSDCDPATLASAKYKGLLDAESLEHLDVHYCRVPVSKIL